MKVKKIALVIFVALFAVYSCKKDDTQILTVNEVININLELKEVKTTSVWTFVSYDFSTDLRGVVTTGILYRRIDNPDPSFIDASAGWIEGLQEGKKYIMKGYVEVNGDRKEMDAKVFTTLGFYPNNLSGGIIAYQKRKFAISGISYQSNFKIAPEISGYLKIGSDSLALESVEVITDSRIDITLPKDTQYFFENDEEYIMKKAFTIGLLSGDYYTEVKESRSGLSLNYWVEDTPHFTLYNRHPFIDRAYQFEDLQPCGDSNAIQLNLTGGFGAIKESLFYPQSELEYDEIAIIITKNDDDKEIISHITYDDQIESGIVPCELNQFQGVETLGGFSSMAHSTSTLVLRLDRELYPNGDYQIQFKGTDLDDNKWESSFFDFAIDME